MTTPRQFATTARPRHSPWGEIDDAKEIAPGIWSVGTPSHGGFLISAERRAAMPKYLRDIQTWAGGNAYEEDSDVAIVVLSFPQYFSEQHVKSAREVITEMDREPKAYEIGKAYYETMRAAAQAIKQMERQQVIAC